MFGRSRFALVGALCLVSACSRDPQKLKQQYVESGDSYAAQKKYSEAILQYRNAVAQDVRFGEGRFKLAKAYEASGDMGNALREYVRAADLLPDDVDVQVRAGRLLNLAGQFPEAKTRALAALAKEPKNVSALIVLGNALAGLKDIDGAIEQAEAAVEADPQVSFTYANLGALQLTQGSRDSARDTFKRAVEISPKSLAAHLNLGNFYWAIGDRTNAEAEFKTSYGLESTSEIVNRTLAAFYTLGGKRDEAEPYLKNLATQTTDPVNKLALIDYYLGAGRTKDAVALLEPLSKDADRNATVPARLRLAVIDYTEGRREQAYAAVDGLLKQYPGDERTLETKVKFLMIDRKFQDAIPLTTEIIKADPQAVRTYYLRAAAFESVGSLDDAVEAYQRLLELAPSSVAAHMGLANLYVNRGQSREALELLGPVLKAAPRSGEVHLLIGKARLQSGDLNAAEAEIVPLATANPKSIEVQATLGRLYLAKNELLRARRAFERLAELKPDSFPALNGLVTIDVVEKKGAAAHARLEAALARTPDDPAVNFLAGNSLLELGDLERAEALLRKVIELSPTNLDAYSRLASLYLKQNRLDEARVDLETAARQQAKPVVATTIIGMILDLQGKPAEARQQYERALAFDASAAVAANNLAWQYAESGENLDVALKLAQTARAKIPDNAQVSDTLGWVYYKKGLPSLAVSTLQEAAKQNPSAPSIHYHLGLAQLKNGDRQQGQASLERALKLNRPFKGADDARQVLASLKTS